MAPRALRATRTPNAACVICGTPHYIWPNEVGSRTTCSRRCGTIKQMRAKARSLMERFEEKYIPEPNSGCWLWIGAATARGYGALGLEGAHRVSYRLFNGAIPTGSFVCHRCDNPICVNPEHLFVGTPKENTHDALRKRRLTHGDKHPNSKLREADIPIIRELAAKKTDMAEIGRRFGVGKYAIQCVVRGKWWKHVA